MYVKYKGSDVANGGSETVVGDSRLYTFIGDGTLTFDLSGVTQADLSATIANPITGTGSLTFDGFGGLTLSAANTFSGDTRITFSTLGLANVNALQNSKLDLNTNDFGTVSFDVVGDNTYTFGGLSGTRDLNFGSNSLSIGGNDAHTIYSGVLSGSGSLTKTGSGVVQLQGANTYSGGTTVSGGGVLRLTSDASLGAVPGSATVNVTLDNGGLQNNAASLTTSANRTISLGAGGGSLTAGWSSPAEYAGQVTGSGALTINNDSGRVILSNTGNDYAGTTTIGDAASPVSSGNVATLQLGGSEVIPHGSGKGNLVFGGIAGAATLDLNGFNETVNAPSGGSNAVIDNTAASSVSQFTANIDSGSVTYDGVIQNSGSSASLAVTKSGAGTWVLGGASTFTGGVNIAAGTLTVSQSGTVTSLGDSGNVITFTGPGTLNKSNQFDADIDYDITAASGVDITLSSLNAVNINGDITTTSNESTIIAEGNILSTGANANWNGPIQIKERATLRNQHLPDVAEPIRLGTTNGSSGEAKYQHDAAAPATIFNNRYFELMGTTSTGDVRSNADTGRALQVNTDLVVTGVGDKIFQLSGTNPGENIFAGKIDDGTGSVIRLRKLHGGRWRLSNTANGYSGTTELGDGTVEVVKLADGGLPSSIGTSSSSAANLLLGNTSVLRYIGSGDSTDRGFTINGTADGHTGTLEASGTGALNYTNTGSPAYRTANQTRTLGLGGTSTDDNTLAANIADNGSGAVSLTKSGAGTWVLTGSSTYTGSTSVTDGRLAVNGSLGSTAVTISGGTLGGAGSIGGSVSVQSGGTLAPGNSIQSLAAGATAFDAGGTYAYEVDSSAALSVGADLLTVAGNLSIASGSLLTFTDIAASPTAFTTGTVFTMINYSGTWDSGLFTYSGTVLADGDTFTVGSQDWVIDYDATTGGSNFTGDYLPSSSFVTVTAAPVPEPSTFALAGMAVLGGLGELARRRRKAAGSR